MNSSEKTASIYAEASTPEELLVLPEKMPINLDVLMTISARSLALLTLIQQSGQSGAFPSHQVTMHALWALEGLLTQQQQMLRAY